MDHLQGLWVSEPEANEFLDRDGNYTQVSLEFSGNNVRMIEHGCDADMKPLFQVVKEGIMTLGHALPNGLIEFDFLSGKHKVTPLTEVGLTLVNRHPYETQREREKNVKRSWSFVIGQERAVEDQGEGTVFYGILKIDEEGKLWIGNASDIERPTQLDMSRYYSRVNTLLSPSVNVEPETLN